MARKGMSGWFVEIPTELKREFEMLYPGRRVKKRLTMAAIRWAIKERPTLDANTTSRTRSETDTGGEGPRSAPETEDFVSRSTLERADVPGGRTQSQPSVEQG